jgi:hypothetical protein
MIERFCSGRLPRLQFPGPIGNRLFKTCHSASVRSPLLKPASKKQPWINTVRRRQRSSRKACRSYGSRRLEMSCWIKRASCSGPGDWCCLIPADPRISHPNTIRRTIEADAKNADFCP